MTSATRLAAPDGTANTRLKVGVSEIVEFTVPQAANWATTAGSLAANAGLQTAVWTAPEAAGAATITATVPATGATCSMTVQIVLPAISMVKLTEDPFAAGAAGAGMRLRLFFNPLDVSFNNSDWLEEPGPATGVTGYFLALQTAGTDLSHHPTPNWIRISARNTTLDHAAVGPLPKPWSDGAFEWVIPNKVGKTGTNAGQVFTNTVQSFSISAAGVVTVSKGGRSVSRSP